MNGTTYYAGNVSSSYSSIVLGTAGIDCSGFVCRAFLLTTKYGTYTMRPSDNSGPFVLDTNGFADGYDVWIKNSHTMLNIQTLWTGNIEGYLVFEATTKDQIDTCDINWHDYTYTDGFTLYKYINFDSYN